MSEKFDIKEFNPMDGFQDLINDQLEEYNSATVDFIMKVPLKEELGEAYASIMLLPQKVGEDLKMVALLATFDKDGKHIRTLSNFDLQHLIGNLKVFSVAKLMGVGEEEEAAEEDEEFNEFDENEFEDVEAEEIEEGEE